ncbi:hypothetical protein HOV93_10880 [Planctomycetes bacterium FF15]|uniref:Lipoprotein n=1 Tax=Bremerella alba TaxID=980252 RepID=A0A7V8V2U9_9BACT|nr:hypothetical protein [Bremerella alba]MBA2113935.1 hypothetical protein [Bremerella alba]
MQRTAFALSLVCLTVLAASGCSSLGKMPSMPWEDEEPEYKVPLKMVVTWKDAVRYNPHDPPTRGFGGRIHFYDETQKPVRVQGGLTIYGYDDVRHGDIDNERPDRKFVFEAEKLQSHYSASKLGHSYSFWVPWDRAGGEQKEITLAPFFRTATGQLIMSEQSKHLLMGVAKKEENPSPSPQYQPSPSDQFMPEVAQANFQRNAAPGLPPMQPQGHQRQASQLNTTTISLPSTMKERLRNAVPTNQQAMPQQMMPANYPQQPMMPSQYPQQPAMPQQPSQPLMDQASAQYRGGPYQSRAPQSMQLKPGVNLQTFRPDFANSKSFSNYLANGPQATDLPVMAPAIQSGSLPMTHQLPVTQTVRPTANHLPTPQSPTLWPPGLPHSQ